MQLRFSAAEQDETWDRFEAGESMRSIARWRHRRLENCGDLPLVGELETWAHGLPTSGTIDPQVEPEPPPRSA
jgi:hypothetical protein